MAQLYHNLIFCKSFNSLLMSNTKIKSLIKGQSIVLTPIDFVDLQKYCGQNQLSLLEINTIALTLYRFNLSQSQQFLSYVADNILNKAVYADKVNEKIKLKMLINLTALSLAKASRASQPEQLKTLIGEVFKHLNLSQKGTMQDLSNLINRALYYFYEGDLTKAMEYANRIYQSIKNESNSKLLLNTMMLQAQIYFAKKNYQKALQCFKKCLFIKKTLPIKARLGMAYCFFNEGKYQMAKLCFQRIIGLDAACGQAYIGLAIIFQRNEEYQKYFQYLKKAYKFSKEHPLVLLHLAEHFIVQGNHKKVKELCQKGLKVLSKFPTFFNNKQLIRNDYNEFYARFNNMIGQTYHMKQNYEQAITYYELAAKSGLAWNQLQLAQCYIFIKKYPEAIYIMEELYKQHRQKGKDMRILNDSYRIMAYLKTKVTTKQQKENPQFYFDEAIKFNRSDVELKIQMTNYLSEVNPHKSFRILQEIQNIYKNQGVASRPEIIINISTLLLQNHQFEQVEQRLKKLIQVIKVSKQFRSVKRQGLLIIAMYNYGIALQRQNQNQKALALFKQITKMNQYHIDSYLRMALIYNKLGNIQVSLQYFQSAQNYCKKSNELKFKENKLDRVLILKAYILNQNQMTAYAKRMIKNISSKELYVILLQKSIEYEDMMRREVDINTLKQSFLRPNRQFCFETITQDPHLIFVMMLFTIVLSIDKKITLNQAAQFFNMIKLQLQQQLPSVIYNIGLCYLNYNQYESSASVLINHRDRQNVREVDQLIAFNKFMMGDYNKALTLVKKNILKQPGNMRFRAQYYIILDKQCKQDYSKMTFQHKNNENKLGVCHSIKRSFAFFKYIQQLDLNKYVKQIESVEKRQNVLNRLQKLQKIVTDDIINYTHSYLKYFQQHQTAILSSQQYKLEIQKQRETAIKNMQRVYGDRNNVIEQDQSQEAKILRQKRERVLKLTKAKSQEMDIMWKHYHQKNKIADQEKNKKRDLPKFTDSEDQKIAKKRKKLTKLEHKEQQTPVKKQHQDEEQYYDNSAYKKQKNLDKNSEKGSEKSNSKKTQDIAKQQETQIQKYLI